MKPAFTLIMLLIALTMFNTGCDEATDCTTNPVKVTIKQIGKKLIADVESGRAPYTYTWSNGANGKHLDTLVTDTFGRYSVLVIDFDFCRDTAFYNYTIPCLNLNCLNGGTCVNGVCNCPLGFAGDSCEIL